MSLTNNHARHHILVLKYLTIAKQVSSCETAVKKGNSTLEPVSAEHLHSMKDINLTEII